MQRLAQLEHHVVGDIDRWADGAQARAAQPLLQPVRRRPGVVYAADHARQHARCSRGGAHSQRVHLRTGDIDCRPLRLPCGLAQQCRHLARQTLHRHGITAIGIDAHLEDDVIQIEVLAQFRTHGRISGQFEYAF